MECSLNILFSDSEKSVPANLKKTDIIYTPDEHIYYKMQSIIYRFLLLSTIFYIIYIDS